MAALQLHVGRGLQRNHVDANIYLQSPHRNRETKGRGEGARGVTGGLTRFGRVVLLRSTRGGLRFCSVRLEP